MMEFVCGFCGAKGDKLPSAVNRAIRNGNALYCNREHSGLGRRQHKTAEQKRAEKAAYDRRLRAERGEELRAQKRAARMAMLATDPNLVRAREKANREQRKMAHVEYCRRPEYREWKAQYDRKYRAEREYGPFAPAFLTLLDLEQEVSTRATRYEIYMERGTINKTQQRKREYGKAVGC